MLSVFALNTGSPQRVPKRLAKVLPVSKLSSLCPTIVCWQVETPSKPEIGRRTTTTTTTALYLNPVFMVIVALIITKSACPSWPDRTVRN